MSWRRSERVRRERLPILDDYNPSMVPSPERKFESWDVVQQLLAKLAPADRAVLLLFLDNVTYSDMAQILGATEGALRVRIHRIKQQVAELYQGQYDEH
jgi:RNA polymerase sigma-70 factor (ECF subfamily)